MFVFSMMVSIFCLLLSTFFKEKCKLFFLLIGIVIYSILVAFKGYSGSDTIYYYHIFSENISYKDTAFYEPGFIFIKDLVKFFGGDFNYINYIQSFIVFLSLFLMARKQNVYIVCIYITLCGLTIDFSTLRQSFSLHLFTIVFFLFDNKAISTFISGFFHFSSIFSYVNKFFFVKLKRFIILIPFFLIFYFLFLRRYLDEGDEFIFRSGFSWLLLLVTYSFSFYLAGYRGRQLLFMSLLLYFPIGFRVIAYLLVVEKPKKEMLLLNNKIFIFLFLVVISWLKIHSYSLQSVKYDMERSVILHYEVNI